MHIWILLTVIGFIFIIIGLITFIRKYPEQRPLKNSTFMIGIFIPMLFAFFYAETLITEFFPGLTYLDLAAFYLIGMISGLFVALLLVEYRSGKFNK
jgi:hypothetical protein